MARRYTAVFLLSILKANISNEWYAKDTSKKIRAVMKVKGNAGEHLATMPPYGYMKSSDDKKQWVKDEEAAQVVYEIGLYIMDGLGPSQIARKLTERKILTPAAYYASKGRTTNVTKKGSPYAWDSSTIADIMDRWREYLGHTVNFKTRKKSYKSKKTLHNPESEWKIFENTHEAIWTEAIADAARLARQSRRRPTKMGEMGMFSGMMFCADCGSNMVLHRAHTMSASYNHFTCRTYKKDGEACTGHYIRECVLDEVVLEDLRRVTAMAREHPEKFAAYIGSKQSAELQREIRRQEKELAAMRKRKMELDTIFKKLYEDSVLGRITTEQFQMLSGSYTEEQSCITAGIPQKESEIQCLRETVSGTDSFLDKAKRYTDITELTPELLRLFIEKIVVHEKEVKWSKHAPQTVEIYYNGIGYVGSGQQDVEEALEAPESLQTQDTEKPRQAS